MGPSLVQSRNQGILVDIGCCRRRQEEFRLEGVRAAKKGRQKLPGNISFTTLEEFEKALDRALTNIDLAALAERITQAQLDQLRGRV
jgi:hypothetical protein